MTAPSPLDEHFLRPRNAGLLEGADLKVEAENPVCGDLLRLTLLRRDGRVLAARFQVYGCPAAIAAGSLLTELVEGKTVEELLLLTQEAISKALGGLGTDNLHAAVLARDAVQAVVRNWNLRS